MNIFDFSSLKYAIKNLNAWSSHYVKHSKPYGIGFGMVIVVQDVTSKLSRCAVQLYEIAS